MRIQHRVPPTRELPEIPMTARYEAEVEASVRKAERAVRDAERVVVRAQRRAARHTADLEARDAELSARAELEARLDELNRLQTLVREYPWAGGGDNHSGRGSVRAVPRHRRSL